MRKVERELRKRLRDLEAERDKIRADREKLREHFVNRFKWWIKLLGDSETPSLPWLIEDDVKWLRRMNTWYW